MKYTIETTEKGCIETLEVKGKIFTKETYRTYYGCSSNDVNFAEQLEECGYDDEILDRVNDLYDGFAALEFLELAEEAEGVVYE